MKITQELRNYVNTTVKNLIPEPLSRLANDEAINRAVRLKDEFEDAVKNFEFEFINRHKAMPEYEGYDISIPSGYHSYALNVNYNNHPDVVTYRTELNEYIDYIDRVITKILAILSVHKEVDSLDEVIRHAIESLK